MRMCPFWVDLSRSCRSRYLDVAADETPVGPNTFLAQFSSRQATRARHRAALVSEGADYPCSRAGRARTGSRELDGSAE